MEEQFTLLNQIEKDEKLVQIDIKELAELCPEGHQVYNVTLLESFAVPDTIVEMKCAKVEWNKYRTGIMLSDAGRKNHMFANFNDDVVAALYNEVCIHMSVNKDMYLMFRLLPPRGHHGNR